MGTAKARGSYEQRKAEALAAGRVKVAKPASSGPAFSLRQLFGLIWEQSTPAKKVKAEREKKPSESERATRRALIHQQRQVGS